MRGQAANTQNENNTQTTNTSNVKNTSKPVVTFNCMVVLMNILAITQKMN